MDAPNQPSDGSTNEAIALDGALCTQCQLLALEPSVANTGDTITFEGTFNETVTINFPGGAAVPAATVGSHRASVLVPATATTGDLTITTGGVTLGPLPFHHAGAALGLGAFAAESSTLSAPREAAAGALVKNFIYVVGGYSRLAGSYFASVEQATIGSDGSLGGFSVVPSVALTTARSNHAVLVVGGFLYVIGGYDTSGTLDSIEAAPIAGDGSLGSFSVVGHLTTPRAGVPAVVIGNSVYVVGGYPGEVTVERSTISVDGTLGPFALVSDVTLAVAQRSYTTLVAGNRLYVIGGYVGGNSTGMVERATITDDGAIGTFSTVANVSLNTPRGEHRIAHVGHQVYVIGGDDPALGAYQSIEGATVAADGTLGAFTPSAATLAVTRTVCVGIVANDFTYVIGGMSGTNDVLDSTERAALE